MKKEIRTAIAQAIKDSDLNGYKWTITSNGLRWSYLDENEQFTFVHVPEENILRVDGPCCLMAFLWYGEDEYADCKTLTEAYYLATKATIAKANWMY